MFGEAWPEFPAADSTSSASRIDFVGINYYMRAVTKNDPTAMVERAARVRTAAGDLHRDRMGSPRAGADRRS